MFKIDDHMGIAIAGLTADGRVLCKYMRNECINHRSVVCLMQQRMHVNAAAARETSSQLGLLDQLEQAHCGSVRSC